MIFVVMPSAATTVCHHWLKSSHQPAVQAAVSEVNYYS